MMTKKVKAPKQVLVRCGEEWLSMLDHLCLQSGHTRAGLLAAGMQAWCKANGQPPMPARLED